MQVKDKRVKQLLIMYKEISLLGKVNALLGWDTNVNLPPKGSKDRAEQTAYITKLISDKWLGLEFKTLLEEAIENTKNLSNKEKAIVRNLNWAGKYYFNVPQKTIVEFSKTTSNAFMAWNKARINNKFEDFLPHLTKIISMSREIAEHLGYKENPYDALLDMCEPGLTTGGFQKVVDILQPELTILSQKIYKSKVYKDAIKIKGGFGVEDQERITHFILAKIGYDSEAGRQDVSPHPFTETLGSQDVRITNRYKMDSFIESIMVAMHEGGHALYEQGVDADYDDTPLAGGVSLGIHESQSRFWENQIGRSKEFVEFLMPVLKAYYPKQLEGTVSDDLFKHFNQVVPGFIRVEADEVTYNLHIMLRFEIENSLINGKVNPKDLPELWNAKMKKYLGVKPDSDANGVLQDVHWSYGSFGYFPTYTLGNLYSAQMTRVMDKKLRIKELCTNGDLAPILSWLRTNIHKHGSLYWPDELCKKVTGEKLNPKYFLDYIKQKYTTIYNLM